MKKFFSVILCAIVPILLCTGCEASNAEIANSLDGNMTRLVYSIGYLDSVSVGEMNELIENSAYFNNVNVQNNSTSAMNDYTSNGFRSNTFNNSICNNLNNVSTSINNGTQNLLNDTNELTNVNGSICDNANLNTGNATTSTLGGLCSNEDIANGNTLLNTNSNNELLSGTSTINDNIGALDTNNSTYNNCCNNSTCKYSNNNYNNSTTNGLTTGTLANNNINNNIASLSSTEETTTPVTYVDTSLLLTSASDLNEILMLISQKRGIIMLYCTDLRAGNGTLTLDQKNAISEYITIIKETTNYLNTFSNTLTTYINNIKTIAYTENSQELVNAKLIRANEILKTRYAKLDTCIDSLDAIIAILQNAVGMDYSANYTNQITTQNTQNGTTAIQSNTPSTNIATENIQSQTITPYTNNSINGYSANNVINGEIASNQNGTSTLYSNNCCQNSNNNYTNQVIPNCPCLNNSTPHLLPDSNKSVIVDNFSYGSNCCNQQNYNKMNNTSNNLTETPNDNVNSNCCNNINSINANNVNSNQAPTLNSILSKNIKPDYLTNPPEYEISTLPLEYGAPVITEQNTKIPSENTEKPTSMPSQSMLPRPENIISTIETSANNILDITPANLNEEILINIDSTNTSSQEQIQEIKEENVEAPEINTTNIINKEDIEPNIENTVLVEQSKKQTSEKNIDLENKSIIILPSPIVNSKSNISFKAIATAPRINDEKTIQFLPFSPKFN